MCIITHIKIIWPRKIISKSIGVCQYINIFVQIKRPTVYIILASLKSKDIYCTCMILLSGLYLQTILQVQILNFGYEQLIFYRTNVGLHAPSN